MKAVILAAGQGTRIRSIHGERPKCLIEEDGSTILDYQLDALALCGIHQVAIVVGYEKQQIVEHVRRRSWLKRQHVEFIVNPAYAITNNIYSLWLALEWVKDCDFIVLNADVVLDGEILEKALKATAPISMIVDPAWREETMKVVIADDRVLEMSKKITQERFSATYIGITLFNKGVWERFADKMNDLVMNGRENEFFNSAVQELVHEGIHVGFTSTEGLPWAEIDDPTDLSFARQTVFPQLSAATS